jgi:PIN domain nuclease of toxin-antitoxin system
MRLLLDTHVYIWVVEGDKRLSKRAHYLIKKAEMIFVSSVSIVEASIKANEGKLNVDVGLLAAQIDQHGFYELPVLVKHVLMVRGLPLHHRDPFDRLLIAQAISEPLNLLTADKRLPQYSPLVIRHA